MRSDPSVDVEQLEKHFGKNYSEMLRMRELNNPEGMKHDKSSDSLLKAGID